ncbi:DUF2147 domain-containing protein [Sphingomonas sp. KR1UV-12]|uniref:DUF2147 domain-containing protein n=1 Tax=Sphingomonas aurea TaxID=3063994 RepID=A0ABT9EI58_9SPHN|nr:DUF2147 domain-containing protein [Sphingomonas sp. KR1UV-12]MDP1026642.1 DUF2147 domain-containing protein [Sphingomonas sp. KR1UV-12]
MSRRGTIMAVILALAAATPVAAVTPAPAGGDLWLNPHRSVAVHMGSCGDRLCGWIVWANEEALSDAHDAGIDHLVGTTLLQDYRPSGVRRWKGTVFVPDMGHSFASEIDEINPGALKVKGCVLGGLICKSQIWTRIASVPRA